MDKLMVLGVAASVCCGAFAADKLTVSANTKIDADTTVSSIEFTGGYALTGTGRITIEVGGGITVAAGAKDAVKAASIANPVTFAGTAAQTITLGAYSTLNQTGVWSGAAQIQLQGAASGTSTLNLRGANDFTGAFSSLACGVHVYHNTGLGTTDGATSWEVGNANGSVFYFHNGTFAEKLTGSFKGYAQSLQVAAGETAEFTGDITLSSTGYLYVPAGATMIVSKSLAGGNYFCPNVAAGGVLRIADGGSLNCVCLNPGGDGTIELYAANGGSDNYPAYTINGKGTIKMMKANAINSSTRRGGSFNASSTWDLNGFSQSAGLCRGGSATATIKSDAPATLSYWMGDTAVTNANMFKGAVSVEKHGAGELTLSSDKNTSTGTLFVKEGGMTLDATGAWAGDVDVASGATLTLVGNKGVRNVTVAAGGKLVLDGTLNAESVTLGGVVKERGRAYDASNSEGCIEGAGKIVSFGGMLTVSEDMELTDDRYVSGIAFTGGYTLSGAGKIHLLGGISAPSGTATIENDVEFGASGAVDLTVGTSGVLVQTGVWSGSTPLNFVGAGSGSSTHRFELRGENTFDGNITMTMARIDAYNGKAFGSTVGSTAMGKVGGETGSIIHFHGGEYAENFTAGGVTFSGWWKPAKIDEGINIFSGSCGFGNPMYEDVASGATAIHSGTVSCSGNYCVAPAGAGAAIVLTNGCTVLCANFNPGGSGRNGGTLYLYAQVNAPLQVNGTCITLMRENAFNCATRTSYFSNSAYIDLNGFDQEGGQFIVPAGNPATFYSETAATWKARQGTSSYSVPYIFDGAVSLEKYGTGVLTLTGASTTTGDLRIREGDVTLGEGASWAGTVKVASGTTLSAVGKREVSAIEIEEGGKLVLASGVTLLAKSVTVGGTPLVPGRSYSKAKGDAFIDGDGVLMLDAAASTIAWTAGGANDLISNPANWGEETVDLESGMAAATFATDGTRADVDCEASFSGLTFTVPDFSFASAAPNARLTVVKDGLAFTGGTDESVYAFDVPVALNESASVTGLGWLHFLRGVEWLPSFSVKNVNVLLSGESEIARNVSFSCEDSAYKSSRGRLWISNAVVRATTKDARFSFADGDRYYPIEFRAGTTNWVGVAVDGGNAFRPIFRRDSRTEFSGGGSWGSYCVAYFEDRATVVVSNKVITALDVSLTANATVSDVRFVFDVAGNVIYHADYGTTLAVGKGIVVETQVADVLAVDRKTGLDIRNGGTLDLCGNDQHFGPLRPGQAGGVITSAEPAVCSFNQTYVYKKSDLPRSTTNTVVSQTAFSGAVTLEKKGELELDLAGVSDSTGALSVTDGTLAFAENGSWRGASAVTVSGGTLKLDRKNRIAKTATLSVTGGKVDIAAGVVQRVAAGGLLGDVPMAAGTSYGSSASKAEHKDDVHFSGSGMVITFDPGTLLIVR